MYTYVYTYIYIRIYKRIHAYHAYTYRVRCCGCEAGHTSGTQGSAAPFRFPIYTYTYTYKYTYKYNKT